MTALAWTEFEKRRRANLKTFWQMVINNRRFVLAKATQDWTGEMTLTNGIQLTGLAYETDRIVNGKKQKSHRTFFPHNYRDASTFADAVEHRLPLTRMVGRNVKVILYDQRSMRSLGILHKAAEFGGGSTSLNTSMLQWGQLEFYANLTQPKFNLLDPGKQIELYWLNDFNDLVSREREKLRQEGMEVCLDLEIGGVEIHNVIGAMGAPGAASDPKADIVFVVCGSGTLSYTGYASLKDGTDVKHFQQWGGLSDYKTHPEVIKFAEDLKQMYPRGVAQAGGRVNIGREIQDRSMKIRAIYGKEYRQGHYSSESVQFIIQGSPRRLMQRGKSSRGYPLYRLDTGSTHQYSDRRIDQNKLLTEATRPVIMARADRQRNDLDIPQTRVFIYSAGGRSNWTWI